MEPLEDPRSYKTIQSTFTGGAAAAVGQDAAAQQEEQEEQELEALWEEAPLLALEEMVRCSYEWSEAKRDALGRITPGVHTKQRRVRGGKSREIASPKYYLSKKLAGEECAAERKRYEQLEDEQAELVPDLAEGTEHSVLRTIRRRELQVVLQQAIQRLSPCLRDTLLLEVEMDFQHAEVAKHLGIPYDTARMRFNNACKKLRLLVPEEWATGL